MSDYYHLARDQYLELGIDTDQVLDTMNRVVISLHCWQGDDIRGFEPRQNSVGGGLQITGNYPGRARNIEELQQDLEYVMQLLPGRQKVSLHAIYGDYKGASIDRDQIRPEHFQNWIDWAKQLKTGLDFNATCFAHPNASSGRTLAHKDQKIREFWINHVKACRGVAAEMGHQLGEVCVHNLWIPDASKDTPADRMSDRQLLIDSLDRIYEIHYSEDRMLDSVESKLFGIGGESMTVGSHEFYLGYALKNNLMVCLDNGHFHPTEQVADKISALIPFVKGLLLHLTRGVRWDSDHVATFNDEICAITQEVVQANAWEKIFLGLDYFDASINRIGAYVVGARAVQKAFLRAMLQPVSLLKQYETENRLFERLALLEELKTMPFGGVWDEYCRRSGVPGGRDYIHEIETYEQQVLRKRNN